MAAGQKLATSEMDINGRPPAANGLATIGITTGEPSGRTRILGIPTTSSRKRSSTLNAAFCPAESIVQRCLHGVISADRDHETEGRSKAPTALAQIPRDV